MDFNWQDRARCRGESTDLDIFFGPDGERQPEREIREEKAKAVCARCPVRQECLSYAVERPEKHGVWGAMNSYERAYERRRKAKLASYHRNKEKAA